MSKPTCINLPRMAVNQWTRAVDPKVAAWISIGEPGLSASTVNNATLNRLPNLRIDFWDIVEPLVEIGTDRKFLPPTPQEAAQIVDFILAHKEKNFLVNCQAGVSRSGAVCQFLQDCLGHQWDEDHKKFARPNKLLLQMMKDYYYA